MVQILRPWSLWRFYTLMILFSVTCSTHNYGHTLDIVISQGLSYTFEPQCYNPWPLLNFLWCIVKQLGIILSALWRTYSLILCLLFSNPSVSCLQSVRIHWKLFTCCLNNLDSNFNYRLKTVLEPRVGYFFPAFIAHWTQPHSQNGSVRQLYQNTYFHEENTN